MASASSWQPLPQDQVEHQISQIDLLMAMYPTDEEVSIDSESSALIEAMKAVAEEGSSYPPGGPLTVTMLLTLTIFDAQDSSQGQPLQLDVNVPFTREAGESQDEAPKIKVRIRQPPWLNRASTAQLNAQIPDDEEDLFTTIQSIQDLATQHLEEAKQAECNTTDASSSFGPLVRVWFYFPSISTRSKRDDFIINAPHYKLTGFLYAGKPGLLCVEGDSQQIDDYMKFIKTESWGDIPSHHKKVSERHREKDIQARAFEDMEEITDSVGERRGQRANRGDMKAIEGWLTDRGLGDAFAKVLM